MPRFAPFPGLRYDTARAHLADVTSPPYDVIDADERATLAARHPNNAVHIDCPVGEADRYDVAAATLRRWIDDGVLVDDEPSLYLYRMAFTDESGQPRSTLGVVGALGLEPPGEGDVLPHERTTPKAKSDRLHLLRATEANLSPIWGLSLANELTKLLDPATAEPLGSWRDDEGVGHELWRLADAGVIEAVCEAVAGAPVVIADGHHRYETCLAFAAERPDLPGASSTLCFVVELVDEQLTVQPIHRLLRGLPSGFDVLAALAGHYEVAPVDAVRPGEQAVVTPERRARLRPPMDDGTLDTVRLDAALASFPPHELSYQHGVANVLAAVDGGRADAGVLVRPVSVAQIEATAHARDRMPPKTTFFWPKPRTGLVFRRATSAGDGPGGAGA